MKVVPYPFCFIQVEVLAWYSCLSASRIYNTFSIWTRRKKKKSVVIYPFWFIQVEVLAYNYSWALVGYIKRLGFRPVEQKLGSRSTSFLVHPGRSPCMILLCLIASWIYNTFSIWTRRKKKKKKQVVLYPFWFIQVEVLAYNYAWALLGYIKRLAFRPVEEKLRQLFYVLSGSSR